jgi:hypothetical protein
MSGNFDADPPGNEAGRAHHTPSATTSLHTPSLAQPPKVEVKSGDVLKIPLRRHAEFWCQDCGLHGYNIGAAHSHAAGRGHAVQVSYHSEFSFAPLPEAEGIEVTR